MDKYLIKILVLFILAFGLYVIDRVVEKMQQPTISTVIVEPAKLPYTPLGEFEITYYTHTGNKTSTGVYPKPNHTIAVDPRVIPYGSFLYVEGKGYYMASDCGGDIKGNRLDIFVDTHEEAVQNGRHTAKVYILEV